MYVPDGWSASVNFTLPSPPAGTTWYRVTDTCNWAEGPNQVSQPGTEAPLGGSGYTYNLCARGILLLIAR